MYPLLDEGLVRNGRCAWGPFKIGFICEIGRRTFRIKWMDGNYTTHLRPDLDEDDLDEIAQRAAE
jgi:hypothetical protein